MTRKAANRGKALAALIAQGHRLDERRKLGHRFPTSADELSEIAARADVPVTKCRPGAAYGAYPPAFERI